MMKGVFMATLLSKEFDEVLEPLGYQAANFFLAASLYHAHKVSFSVAAELAELDFTAFMCRLQEHFGTGFILDDEVVEADIHTVEQITIRS